MTGTGQPAAIPGEFVERVKLWARDQPAPVSVILFGSRARGDHGPESDWDIAVVYEGEIPSLEGLPRSLADRPVDWVRIKHSRALRRLNVCGIPHALAAQGRCFHGEPLPAPERNEVNIPAAWKLLTGGHRCMCDGIRNLAVYWSHPHHPRWGYDAGIANQGAMAAALFCKAVLHLRGVEPRRSHSVAELCDDLEAAFQADPLLPLLRKCDGRTVAAHGGMYPDTLEPEEDIGASAQRLGAVALASGEVLIAACDVSRAEEGRDSLKGLEPWRDALSRDLERLECGDCPREVLRTTKDGTTAWRSSRGLWDRLLAAPTGRTREEGDRGRDTPGGR